MSNERSVLELVTKAREVAEAHALDVNGDMDDAVLHLRLAERALKSRGQLPCVPVRSGTLPPGLDAVYRDLDHGSRALASAEQAIDHMQLCVRAEDRELSLSLDVDTGSVTDHLSRARRVFEEWIIECTDLGGGHDLVDGLDDGTPSLRNMA